MDDIFKFEKNLEVRLEEYLGIFNSHLKIPANEIKKIWSIYLEENLKITDLKALWKLPNVLCRKYSISYPTIVIVRVESVDFVNLQANVKIVAVPGDIDLPVDQTASLTKLWPTKTQVADLNANYIASLLDSLRFFYYYLWMPWDINDDNNVLKNIFDRLHFFYNMRKNAASITKSRKFTALLAEVKKILEHLGDDGTLNVNSNIPEDTDEDVIEYIDLSFKIQKLKNEYDIVKMQLLLEEPIMFNLNFWLVFQNNNHIDKYLEFLDLLKISCPKILKFKSDVCLQNTLYKANIGDEIILQNGNYTISYSGVLCDGITLKSPYIDNSKVVLESNNEVSLTDFKGQNLKIENLSILIKGQCGLTAECGTMYLKNVQLKGKGMLEKQSGISVLPGAKVILENCHICLFNIGIFVNTLGCITLKNCVLSDSNVPIRIREKATLIIDNCTFKNYVVCGIHVKTESDFVENTNDVVSSLKSKLNTKINDCIFESSVQSVILAKNLNEEI